MSGAGPAAQRPDGVRARLAARADFSEIKLATVGVSDLAAAGAFYRDAFGYVERGAGAVPAAALARAWLVPAGLAGRFAVLGPPRADGGLLRLVQWDAPGERVWGGYARIQDLGHYALNFRVADLGAFWPRLLAAGAAAKSPPRFWRVGPELAAWDSQAYGPDGVLLDVFEVEGRAVERLGPLAGVASELQTVALHVSDAERSAAFYGALGYETLYDTVIERMEGFFGLPPGTRLRNVNLMRRPHSPNGRVELAEYVGAGGRPLVERAVPPNTGLLSASFKAASLEAAAELLLELGAFPVGEAGPLAMPPWGEVRLRTFRGPDGELLEVFEAPGHQRRKG